MSFGKIVSAPAMGSYTVICRAHVLWLKFEYVVDHAYTYTAYACDLPQGWPFNKIANTL